MSITTGKGDGGMTELFSGERVSKSDLRMDALGALDELNSVLGLARSVATRKGLSRQILEIQRKLFVAASELATTDGHLKFLPVRIDMDEVHRIDWQIGGYERCVRMPRGFIVPGGTRGGAHLDHARAVCRRSERQVAALFQQKVIKSKALLVWLNRLSDLLWLMARHEEGASGTLPNTLPKKKGVPL
ncbi:MAG: cob(I)yrinic acid a,c-diamide adenosyltransferase [Lentisphaerota bacterium]